MNTVPPAATRRASVELGTDPVSYRAMRLLAGATTAVVVTIAVNSTPAPGLHGPHLGVSVALATLLIATIGMLGVDELPDPLMLLLLAALVASSAVLVGVQPDGAGILGVFPAVSAAALRLPIRTAGLVAALGVVGIAIGWGTGGRSNQPSIVAMVLNEFGVVAFFVLAIFVRRHREANYRAAALIDELNETRAAHSRAAALAERQRLARDVHDVLAHALSGLSLNLESARLLATRKRSDPAVIDAIARAQRMARTGLDEARRAIGLLRDDTLPGVEQLGQLAQEFEVDTGISCVFSVEGEPYPLPSDASLTLYRVTQEALTNVRKHASPDCVRIRLTYRRPGLELIIEDHRAGGAAPPPSDGTGYGLTGMLERTELLGGSLTAEPVADGFLVEVRLPR